MNNSQANQDLDSFNSSIDSDTDQITATQKWNAIMNRKSLTCEKNFQTFVQAPSVIVQEINEIPQEYCKIEKIVLDKYESVEYQKNEPQEVKSLIIRQDNTNPYFKIDLKFVSLTINNQVLLDVLKQNTDTSTINKIFRVLGLIDIMQNDSSQSTCDQIQNILQQKITQPYTQSTSFNELRRQLLFDVNQNLTMNKKGDLFSNSIERKVQVEYHCIIQLLSKSISCLLKKEKIPLAFNTISMQIRGAPLVKSLQWMKTQDHNYRVLVQFAQKYYAIYSKSMQQVIQLRDFLVIHNRDLSYKKHLIELTAEYYTQKLHENTSCFFMSAIKSLINTNSQEFISNTSSLIPIYHPAQTFGELDQNYNQKPPTQLRQSLSISETSMQGNEEERLISLSITSQNLTDKEQIQKPIQILMDMSKVKLGILVSKYLNFLYVKTIRFEKFMKHKLQTTLQNIIIMDKKKNLQQETNRIVSLYEVQSICLLPPEQIQILKQFSDTDIESDEQHEQEEQLLNVKTEQEIKQEYQVQLIMDQDFIQQSDRNNIQYYLAQWLDISNRRKLLTNLRTKVTTLDPMVIQLSSTLQLFQPIKQQKDYQKYIIPACQNYQIELKKQQGLTLKLFDLIIQEQIGCFKISGSDYKTVQLNFSTRSVKVLIVMRDGKLIFRQDFESFSQDQILVYII